MSTFTGSNFDGGTISLDGNVFKQCTFCNCILEFGATGPVTMDGCVFDDVRWSFIGPASATLQFLGAMANDLGEGGRQVVDHTFAQIIGQKNPALKDETSMPAT